jgi:putative ABC transport system permease protein
MLFREIKKNKGQFAAAAIVILLGISIFSATTMSYKNLQISLFRYYSKYDFLDYYSKVENISNEGVKKVQNMRNVKTAIGRTSIDVGADMGDNKRITLRLISIPELKQPLINKIHLVAGRYFSKRNPYSCILNNNFAKFHGLRVGDTIKVIINFTKYDFNIDGITESPEFLYTIKDPTFPYPSPEDFGILYLKQSTLNALTGNNNFNEVHVLLDDNSYSKETENEIETYLKPYGFKEGALRKDQISNYMINDEISQLKQLAVIFPCLFLSVAALIIYIMMKRIISKQRTLIGVMKAIGYSNLKILGYYVKFSLLISITGTVPGIFLGFLLSRWMTKSYTTIYNLPILHIGLYPEVFIIGILISASFCVLAGLNSAKNVLKIEPAQAMRAEAPDIGRRNFIESIDVLWKRLSFGWKMSVRNLFRNRQRTLLTVMSISFTIMFFMISLFFADSVEYIIDFQFKESQTHDYKLLFTEPVKYDDVFTLRSINGIKKIEPIYDLPVKIEHNWKSEDTLIIGISEDSFYRLLDSKNNSIKVSNDGILIPNTLSKSFDIKKGDYVKIHAFAGSKIEKDVLVTGIIKQYSGSMCYMSIKGVQKLINSGNISNAALLKIQKHKEERIKDKLFDVPVIKNIESKTETLEKFNKLLEFFYSFIYLMFVFGAIMGFAIIFNTTLINIMDRQRELTSLKVLGYTRQEIEKTLIRENVMVAFLSIVPGLVLGKIVCNFMAEAFSNNVLTIEAIISLKTYIISIMSIFVFVALSQLANRKNIINLDMIEVLKNREG